MRRIEGQDARSNYLAKAVNKQCLALLVSFQCLCVIAVRRVATVRPIGRYSSACIALLRVYSVGVIGLNSAVFVDPLVLKVVNFVIK